MANEEQLKRLRQGVREWNIWIRENREQLPLDLERVPFFWADFTGADLSEANLTGANLIGADLVGADLSGANLTGANLTGADLSGANLTESDLTGTDLTAANLSEANLSNSYLSSTVFAKNNLTSVNGLDTISHHGPSQIDFRTVTFPTLGPALVTFLRDVGSSEYLINALNGSIFLFQPVPVKVFVSFAPSDQNLCQNLRNHLSLLVRSGTIVLRQEAVLAPDIHQWTAKMSRALQEAHVILLLVSAPFLASHQAWRRTWVGPLTCIPKRGPMRSLT